MKIKFCIDRDELRSALAYVAPFIKTWKKKESEEYSTDETITLSEPYFEDKVTIGFRESHTVLYVIVDEVKIERSIIIESNCNGPDFCLPFAYLQQELEAHDCEKIRFEEDRFFGFIVYDDKTNAHLFDINAFSVRKQNKISSPYHELPVYHLITLEQPILTELLKDFDKYTCFGRNKNLQYVWCQIANECCTIFATDGTSLRLKKYHTKIFGKHSFSVPGNYASRILSIISQWQNQPPQSIEFDDKWCRIRKNDYRDIIGFAMHLELMPDIQKALNANTIIHKASLKTESIRSTFKMIRAMEGRSHKMILHFLRSHVNIYWKDLLFDRSVFERKEVEGCDEDFVACFDVTTFEKLIEEIDSDIFSLYFVGENMVHVVGGDESLFGDTIRIQCTLKMDEEAFESLKEGDATMHTTL